MDDRNAEDEVRGHPWLAPRQSPRPTTELIERLNEVTDRYIGWHQAIAGRMAGAADKKIFGDIAAVEARYGRELEDFDEEWDMAYMAGVYHTLRWMFGGEWVDPAGDYK